MRNFDSSCPTELSWSYRPKCACCLRRSDADKFAHLKASAGDAAHVVWNPDAAKTDKILKILTLLGNRFGSTRQSIK